MENCQISETERFVYTRDTDTPFSFFAGFVYCVQPLVAPNGRAVIIKRKQFSTVVISNNQVSNFTHLHPR